MPYRPPIHRPAGWRNKAQRDAARPNAAARGYDSKWERASKAFLAYPANRYCACGCGEIAEVVDHKIPHRGDGALFWDRTNWQPMTRSCHSRKTASEDSRWSRGG